MQPAYFKKRITVVVMSLIVVLSMSAMAQSAQATAPPKKIVVQTNRDGNAEIYSMDMDGSNPSNLSQNAGFDGHPDWSAAASKIAFISDRAGGNSLYVMDPGGLNVHQVGTRDAGFPAWSPDGTKIAYSSYGRLRVLDINSGGTASNDHQVGYDASVSHPTWSPDGTQIAYANYIGSGESDIEYISSTGTSTTASTTLTTSTYPNRWYDQAPSWGHDGTIAFVSNRDGSITNLFTIKLGGSMTDITNDASGTGNTIPSWAPGGGVIYYSHKPSGTSTYNVWMITQDGQTRQSINTGESDIVTIQQAPLPVVPSTGAHYVALGDSVASGEGINYGWTWSTGSPYGSWAAGTSTPWIDYSDSTDNKHCHQSAGGYPYLVASAKSASLTNFACTGSSAGNGILRKRVFDDATQTTYAQLGINETLYDPPNAAYDSAQPDVVTMSLGADDVNFSHYVEGCYGFNSSNCNDSTADTDLNTLMASEKTNLRKVLNEIKARGLTAGKTPRVVLTAYYDPFPAVYDSNCPDITPQIFVSELSSSEMVWLEQKLAYLNANIISVASEFDNVVVVPLSGVLQGHGFCSTEPWVFGPSLRRVPGTPPTDNGNPAPFHPTTDGQQAIASQIETAMK